MTRRQLKFHSVTSKNLSAIAFDSAAGKLHVLFSSGAEYAYAAPENAARALLAESDRVDRKVFGASVGALFNRAVKDRFPCERVGAGGSTAGLPAAAVTPPSELESRLGAKPQRAAPEGPQHQDLYEIAGDLMTGGEET